MAFVAEIGENSAIPLYDPDRFLPLELQDYLFTTRFFYPNSCPLCSPVQVSDFGTRILCEKCNMISYCSEEHKKKHLKQHKDLCTVIEKLLLSSKSTDLFGFMKTTECLNQRFKEKYSLISKVEDILKRGLRPDEEQMFLHPRICFECSESHPAKLVNCQYCPQGAFCITHSDNKSHASEFFCLGYNECYKLDWHVIIDEKLENIINRKNFPLSPSLYRKILDPQSDMSALIKEIIETLVMSPIMAMFGDSLWPIVWSKIYSNLLTLTMVITQYTQLLQENRTDLIIHIVGAHESNRKYFAIYEELLHLIPQLLFLKVIVVGEELDEFDAVVSREIGLCEKCSKSDKVLLVETVRLPYTLYMDSTNIYTIPHLIIAYNFGEIEVSMWDETLTLMTRIQAPFFMTTSSAVRSKVEHEKMMTHFVDFKQEPWIKMNPYKSMRPYRDVWQDGIQYENQYLAFYPLFEAKVAGNVDAITSNIDAVTCKVEVSTSVEASTSKDEASTSKDEATTSEDEAIIITVEATTSEVEDDAEAQTSKSDSNLQTEQSEDKVQEQKAGSSKSKKKKRRSRAYKTAEQLRIEQDKFEQAKILILKLKKENAEIEKVIPKWESEFPEISRPTSRMMATYLEDIFTLKICVEELIDKLLYEFSYTDMSEFNDHVKSSDV